VGTGDGESVEATLVGRDPATDLAVLRVSDGGLTRPELGEDALRVGNLVLALGRPGQTVQATLGIVSALGKGWRTRAGGAIDRYLQTDVVMYPGFSGGPLIDASGSIVGLNSSALQRSVAVSVPLTTVRRTVATLLEHGRIRRGYLGIGAQAVRLPGEVEAEVGQKTGLLIVSVEPDSPAQKGGLMLGDTVVALNGQPVGQLDDLLALLGGETVGASGTARIVRGGQLQEQAVTIGECE
jgi:S1-C subfamily serine protease